MYTDEDLLYPRKHGMDRNTERFIILFSGKAEMKRKAEK
jgi:hypothetical protein